LSTIRFGRRYRFGRHTFRMAERTFWRVVRTNPPQERDFLSNEAQGRSPRDDDPETLRLWSGISVYATRLQAQRTAIAYPFLGGFLAELRISDIDPVRWERTRGRGHHTLWGEARLLLERVVAVVPVGTPL
jgi:hypothetical protein